MKKNTTVEASPEATTPAGAAPAGRTSMSLADKVERRAARLATTPLVEQPGSKFAPFTRSLSGLPATISLEATSPGTPIALSE